jgi:haloalkane dehalogenase
VSGTSLTPGGIAYREEGPRDGPVALFLHGYPESSYMWRDALPAAARAGWRAVAPDFPGYGDSPPDPPGTWERHMEAVERFHAELGLGRVALVTHDWGALIGLRWACEHPDSVRALVISSSGFFPDGKWHGLAQALRTEMGDDIVAGMTRASFGALLRQAGPSLDTVATEEYWKAFADDERRRGQLELYRSGDFEKLRTYEGRLAALGVPTLLLWGEQDAFAPLAGGRRFEREIPGSELVVIEGAGHFVWEDEPERTAEELVLFLARIGEG